VFSVKRQIPATICPTGDRLRACSTHHKWKKGQTVCKPGSVPTGEPARDGHSSGTPVTGRLARPTRTAVRKLTWRQLVNKPRRPSLLGLAPGGVYPATPVTGGAVRSYRTLSPLPRAGRNQLAGRFAFCGTFPKVTLAGRYPAPCFRGARTFLPHHPKAAEAAIRPSGPRKLCLWRAGSSANQHSWWLICEPRRCVAFALLGCQNRNSDRDIATQTTPT